MTYASGGNVARTGAAPCRVFLCREPAAGLVAVNVLRDGEPARVQLAACQACADTLEAALLAGRRPAVTPDGNLYLDDLRELLRYRA
jgi:hypothetical protein